MMRLWPADFSRHRRTNGPGGERRWLFLSNKAIAASEGIAKWLKLAASTVERAFTCGLGAGPALPGAELSGGRCSR